MVNDKFTGKERDAETGLDYFGARYMSSAQGRFTSPDPSMNGVRLENPQTWNRYSYVLNNPPVLTDPTGEVWNSDCTWTDTCGVADDRIKTMAIANKNSVTVYGVNGPDDITTYGANDAGYVDVSKKASTPERTSSANLG